MKILILVLILIPFSSFSQNDLSIIAVGEADVAREKIVFMAPHTEGAITPIGRRNIGKIYEQMINDFLFYRKNFEILDYRSKMKGNKTENDAPSFSKWNRKDAKYLVTINFSQSSSLQASVQIYNVLTKKKILKERINIEDDLKRQDIHLLSDRIYRSITGRPSIFPSYIVFVSDRASSKKRTIKELYITDFDGKNRKRLTWHRGIVISPAISADKKKVLYSLIRYSRGRRNVDLYLMDIKTKRTRVISRKPGINSGGVFSRDGESIYLTLSVDGNAEIYQMTIASGKLRRVTRNRAEDVDPSLNNTGKKMAFLSSRPGRAMIYVADAKSTEKSVKRISFVGQFNATPRFNPAGTEIAFSSWVDNRFDIYRINTLGTELVRLTRNFGSNESPSYSEDGKFIVFASQRVVSKKKAIQNLYIMDRDGEILGNITENFGNCLSPRWSK